MAIPNEALQKLVREIETQAVAAQQQIATPGEIDPERNGQSSRGRGGLRRRWENKLEGQTQSLEREVDNLSKRLLYLETTHKNSREHIEQMLRTK
ncbi:hypothetical protein ACJ41O_003002 [Fusarium nematophilum]